MKAYIAVCNSVCSNVEPRWLSRYALIQEGSEVHVWADVWWCLSITTDSCIAFGLIWVRLDQKHRNTWCFAKRHFSFCLLNLLTSILLCFRNGLQWRVAFHQTRLDCHALRGGDRLCRCGESGAIPSIRQHSHGECDLAGKSGRRSKVGWPTHWLLGGISWNVWDVLNGMSTERN